MFFISPCAYRAQMVARAVKKIAQNGSENSKILFKNRIGSTARPSGRVGRRSYARFKSWDRAWQHPNTLRTRLKSIRLQIYGFVPRRARHARASILRALRIVLLVEKKMCKGVPRTSKFYPPPVNGRMGHRYGAHRDRDSRITPVGFANPRVELRVGAPCSQILNHHLANRSCLRYCTF